LKKSQKLEIWPQKSQTGIPYQCSKTYVTQQWRSYHDSLSFIFT